MLTPPDHLYESVSLLLAMEKIGAMSKNIDMSIKRQSVSMTSSSAYLSVIEDLSSPYGSSCLFNNNGLISTLGGLDTIPGGTESFTIEAILKPSTVSASSTIFDCRSEGGKGFLMTQPGADPSAVAIYIGDDVGDGYEVNIQSAAGALSTSEWTHVAAQRDGDVFSLYVDGINQGSELWGGTISWHANLYIGRSILTTSQYLGRMRDIRLTRGVARYSANFQPPEKCLEHVLGGWIAVDLANLKPLSGNAIVGSTSEAPDMVVVIDKVANMVVDTIIPDAAGDWSTSVPSGIYLITYLATGCQPITHGPYTVE